MGDSGGPSESSGGHGSAKDLPVMPGPEKPLLHIAIEFVEMLDNALAEHQMLNVAHGELPAEAACIYDVPIERLCAWRRSRRASASFACCSAVRAMCVCRVSAARRFVAGAAALLQRVLFSRRPDGLARTGAALGGQRVAGRDGSLAVRWRARARVDRFLGGAAAHFVRKMRAACVTAKRAVLAPVLRIHAAH